MSGVALVTGAGRGVGHALVLELADRGWTVHAAVRSSGTEWPDGVTEVVLDVTDPGSWSPPDHLDLLVNNAGLRGAYRSVEDTEPDEWRDAMETNFFAVAELVRRVVPGMRSRGGGVICNVSSSAVWVPMPFFAAYRASKAALQVLGETMRVELAPFGIRVLDAPIGGVDTDMLRSGISHRPPEAIDSEAYRPMAERVVELSAMGRTGAVAPAVAAAAIVDAIEDPTRHELFVAADPNSTYWLDRRGGPIKAGLREMLGNYGLS